MGSDISRMLKKKRNIKKMLMKQMPQVENVPDYICTKSSSIYLPDSIFSKNKLVALTCNGKGQ